MNLSMIRAGEKNKRPSSGFSTRPSVSSNGFDLIQCADEKDIGGRRIRAGAETHLVNKFLLDLPFSAKPRYQLTLFQEPKLLSGFPDLVAVIWHKPTTSHWLTERASITRNEIRILHLLASHGPQTEDELNYLLQMSVRRWVDRLSELELIYNNNNIWRLHSLKNAFAVRHIVALEAKISDFKKALQQASLNRWFASESYVLLPNAPKKSDHILAAQQESVGIWIAGDAEPILPAPIRDDHQPKSLASWFFNEWAWRLSLDKTNSWGETGDYH